MAEVSWPTLLDGADVYAELLVGGGHDPHDRADFDGPHRLGSGCAAR